jgi:hypothetical protein
VVCILNSCKSCGVWWEQVGAFSVLKELVIVLPDSLSDHVGSLVPGIEKALNVSAAYGREHWSCLTYESIWQSAYVVVLVTGQDIKFQPEDRGFDIHSTCNGIPLISSVSSTHKGLFSGFSQTIWRIIFSSCVFCQISPNQPFGTWVSQLQKHELTSVNHVSCLYDFLNGVSFSLFNQMFPDLNPYKLIIVYILIWFRF